MPVPAMVVLTSENTADGETRARLNASISCSRCMLDRFSFRRAENSDIFFSRSSPSELMNFWNSSIIFGGGVFSGALNSDILFLWSCHSEAEYRDFSDASWSTLGTSTALPARRTAVRGTIITERIQKTNRERNDVEDFSVRDETSMPSDRNTVK